MNQDELEKKWREEFYKYCEDTFDLDFRYDPNSDQEISYLQACKARQKEIESIVMVFNAKIAEKIKELDEAVEVIEGYNIFIEYNKEALSPIMLGYLDKAKQFLAKVKRG